MVNDKVQQAQSPRPPVIRRFAYSAPSLLLMLCAASAYADPTSTTGVGAFGGPAASDYATALTGAFSSLAPILAACLGAGLVMLAIMSGWPYIKRFFRSASH